MTLDKPKSCPYCYGDHITLHATPTTGEVYIECHLCRTWSQIVEPSKHAFDDDQLAAVAKHWNNAKPRNEEKVDG